MFNLVLFLIFTNFSFVMSSSIVQTENGLLNGTSYITTEGKEALAFLGVPYAKPPVGDLRFTEPQPAPNWEGVRTAFSFGSKCVQFTYYNINSDPVIGDEDCLYLNIFVPATSNNKKLEVIVYIHGGAFMFGSGDMFTPDYVLNRYDVVFVSINYRLGPFGFLTTEDGVIPGNIGLKDQVQALKWVHNNIEYFGGDKYKTTITGFSAGGASVHLHYLSPLSKNLFQKGISMSGSALCPWVLAENSKKKAQTLASSVGCPSHDSKQMLNCLRLQPAKKLLLKLDSLFMPWHFNPFSPFGVVVENSDNLSFLNKNPYELLQNGEVQDLPWLSSVTTEEGLYPGASFISDEELLQELDENWNHIAPFLLDYNQTVPQNERYKVSEKIRNFYLSDNKISKENVNQILKAISDRLFLVDAGRSARLQASVTNSSVFFYSFGYRGKYSFSDVLCKCNDNFGTSHGDDLIYLLKSPFKLSPFETKDDKEMVDLMVNLWMSFMKYNVPSVGSNLDWSRVTKNEIKKGTLTYVLISSSKKIEQIQSDDFGNDKFWNSLPLEELWNTNIKNNRYVDEL